MRVIYSLVLITALGLGQAWAVVSAPNQGVFTSVNGKVQVRSHKKGHKLLDAKKDSTVVEGDRVITDTNSSATVKLFDGSELKVDPKTTIGLSTLQKPSEQTKVMKFKLFLGKVFASVQKLASSKSSFEIEAGGVVCGVRGTQFTMGYDPGDGHVQVFVQEGTVFTDSNGNITIVPAGHGASFTNGNPDKGGQGNNNPNGNGNGNKDGSTTGLGDLNNQFTDGLGVNGDNTFTDPAVKGAVKLLIHVNVAPGETVP